MTEMFVKKSQFTSITTISDLTKHFKFQIWVHEVSRKLRTVWIFVISMVGMRYLLGFYFLLKERGYQKKKIASIASPTTSSSYYVGFIWTAWTIHIRNLLMDGTFLFNAVHLKWQGIAIILFCRSTMTFSPSFQFSIAAFSCPSNKSGIKWTKNVIENNFFLLKHFYCPFISSTPIYPCWMSQSICRLSPQNPLWNQLKF